MSISSDLAHSHPQRGGIRTNCCRRCSCEVCEAEFVRLEVRYARDQLVIRLCGPGHFNSVVTGEAQARAWTRLGKLEPSKSIASSMGSQDR